MTNANCTLAESRRWLPGTAQPIKALGWTCGEEARGLRRLSRSRGEVGRQDGTSRVATPEEKVLFFLMMKEKVDDLGLTCLQYLR